MSFNKYSFGNCKALLIYFLCPQKHLLQCTGKGSHTAACELRNDTVYLSLYCTDLCSTKIHEENIFMLRLYNSNTVHILHT
jgi:hypothetical protein